MRDPRMIVASSVITREGHGRFVSSANQYLFELRATPTRSNIRRAIETIFNVKSPPSAPSTYGEGFAARGASSRKPQRLKEGDRTLKPDQKIDSVREQNLKGRTMALKKFRPTHSDD